MRRFYALLVTTALLFTTNCVGHRNYSETETPAAAASTMLYRRITIEVDAQRNARPSKEAFLFLKRRLESHGICRADDIRIIVQSLNEPPTPVWNRASVEHHETRNRTLKDRNLQDGHLVIYVAYLSSIYMQGEHVGIAGLQYGDTSIAMFPDHFNRVNEGSVLLHEMGHLLGIACERPDPVNPDRPNHCNNADCVMFWTIRHQDGDFDEACLKEIARLVARKRSRLY